MDEPSRTTGYMVMRSVPEAARDCGVSEEVIRGWIVAGAVSVIEIGGRPMVNAAEVAAVRDRTRRGDRTSARRGLGRSRMRALGIADVVVALIGCLVFVGVGPPGLRTWWWLALCLGSLLVGFLLWRAPTKPSRPRRLG